MNHLLNDHARSVNEARFEPNKAAPLQYRQAQEASVRTTVGNALIRAGTRLVPAAGSVRQAQPNPPC